MAAHQAPSSLGFSRQEHWSGLPFPSPMHESEKWKWSRSVVSDSSRPHGLQPPRLLHPWDFPGKSTGVGCHHLLWFIEQSLPNSHHQSNFSTPRPLFQATYLTLSSGDLTDFSIQFNIFYIIKYILIYTNSISLCNTMEKAMAPHSSTLAWKIPWTEEPGRLQSMGSLRVGHDWATSLSRFSFMHWRRKWQPTPVFLPGESQGRGSLVGCHLWDRTESDTTEAT